MSDWQDTARDLGGDIIANTKNALADEWDALSDADKEWIERSATELAEMAAKRAVDGVEPDPERVALLKATILDYQVVGQLSAYEVQSAFLAAAEEAADVAGSFLAGFVRTLLLGIAPG